jgi:hypothetical protein
MRMLFDRRGFLQALGFVAGSLALPFELGARGLGAMLGPLFAPELRFFTAHERATLEALCDTILPPDDDPGARALGAAAYVENLLTAFERPLPRIFARGPFSGRNPFPNLLRGLPSRRRPADFFRIPLRPSRLQELFWRAEILGSEASPLPPHLDAQAGGALLGLRDVYRAGLARVDEVAAAELGLPFAELAPDDRDDVFQALDQPGVFAPDARRGGQTFVDLLIRHTLEGCFAPPEYGGNADTGGWRMIGLEGDSQPLGYSLFSVVDGAYRERPDHPMSTPNPDELAPDGSLAPRPLSADGNAIQANISSFSALLERLFPGSCP